MRIITTSAPGKLVLSGEYAVLDGAPAISMAVNRRALVTVDETATEPLRSIGVAGACDQSLLQCVCRVLDIGLPKSGVVLDTSRFSDATSGAKLGIGSSAALAAALVRALADRQANDEQVFRLALAAHHEFQQGSGSGVDVATSVFGGLIGYCRDSMPTRLNWPDELHSAFLWSGVPASTTAKLSLLSKKDASASRNELAGAARAVFDSWREGHADAVLDVLRSYVTALKQFDVDHALGIFDAGHDALTETAKSSGIVYKPCGAGGGDVGVVVGSDAAAVSRFTRNASNRGFQLLDVQIDERGAVIDGATG
ncbi:MAG: hypothetical protein HKN77_00325 [Woeseiaceae bacterium]|nr:hypothetical protein [Woeseiaceae bacterium]